MTPYFVKTRINEKQNVKLVAVENGRSTHIIMCYLNGYIQTTTYSDFNNRLFTAESLTPDDPNLVQIRKELEQAVAFPIQL